MLAFLKDAPTSECSIYFHVGLGFLNSAGAKIK